jgi:hypothetical protein
LTIRTTTNTAAQVLITAPGSPDRSASRSTPSSKRWSVTLIAVVTAAADSRSVTSTATSAATHPRGSLGSPLPSTAV